MRPDLEEFQEPVVEEPLPELLHLEIHQGLHYMDLGFGQFGSTCWEIVLQHLGARVRWFNNSNWWR
jgi:hypothetical protein